MPPSYAINQVACVYFKKNPINIPLYIDSRITLDGSTQALIKDWKGVTQFYIIFSFHIALLIQEVNEWIS